MDEAPDLESLQRRGEILAGRYVIGEVLGVGGMGVVYAAVQRSLDRAVAIKVPRPELVASPSVSRKFRNEARAGSRVRHHNVVTALDYGVHGGMPFLVMERVVGVGLAQLVEQGPVPVGLAIDLVADILAGLEQAHVRGVIHGDVKCDNVLVELPPNRSPVPRIIDFGIARFVDDPIDSVDAVVSGTPEYLAPELIRGSPTTVASDVYAVGIILYGLIAGATPFAGGSSADVMTRQLELEPVPLSWRSPLADVPHALDELVGCALSKAPGKRFVDAAAFRRALIAIPHARGNVLAQQVPAPTMFTMEETTATLSTGITPRAKGSEHGAKSGLEQLRNAVVDAVAHGEPDAIVVAHLDLCRAYIDRHEIREATSTLERGVELLAVTPSAPSWRLMLPLAALYDGRGERSRAQLTTRNARDQAVRSDSAIGRQRADELLARLARRATHRPPW